MLRRVELYLPLILMLLIAPFSSALDLEVSHKLYQGKDVESTPFLQWIYVWSPRVVMMGAAILLGIFAISVATGWMRSMQRPAVYIVLVVVIGCGVLINLTLKEVWGRPRPVQTVDFGGVKEFRPFYLPDFHPQGEPSKSFPSGHASGGFALFSLYFLGRRYESRKVTVVGMLATGLAGGVLGYARIVQGGHFLTDILGSAFVLWYTALALDHFMFSPRLD